MRPRLHDIALAALGAAALWLLLPGPIIGRPGGPDIPARILGWGALLQADKACYQVGETARVTHAVYNYTDTDKMVFVGIFGPNGCSYTIEIRDELGQTVWQPGGLDGGFYIPPRCARAPSAPVTIPACGGRIGNRESVQLVYQNGLGIGTLGAPLPPGFYDIVFTAGYSGPHADNTTFGRGFAPSASVPIQILP
jgi:hypothetical protein